MHKTACSYSTPKHNYHIPLAQRFPEDIDCIVYSPHRDRGSLYISNIEAAENPSTLQRYCIKAVMSCAKGYVLNHSKSVVPHYLHIAAVDHQKCDISPYFDQAVDFIQNHLRTTNVLVHCLAGVSRSVSMVIAYFIREHALSDEEAFSLVKSRRKIINPNEGFRQQLKNYHLKMSSSRSQKIIQTYRQNKTPLKQFPQTYDTSKSFLLKNERTLSTDEKSSDANKIKQYCQNVENRRALFAEFKHNELKLQGRELRDKNKEKYYSPSKMESYQQKKMQARMQQKGQKGYFCNLSQDLDQRIQKIKQKYQLHRQKLEQNLYQRHFQSTYEFSKFAKPESDTISHRIDRFKTHSYHQYTQKPNFQSDRENYTDFKTKRDLNGRAELNYKAQSPIGRTVASEVSENGLKSEDRMMNYSCFLSNEHYRVSGALQKKDEVMWGYKYMEMMSNASKKNYRQLN